MDNFIDEQPALYIVLQSKVYRWLKTRSQLIVASELSDDELKTLAEDIIVDVETVNSIKTERLIELLETNGFDVDIVEQKVKWIIDTM